MRRRTTCRRLKLIEGRNESYDSLCLLERLEIKMRQLGDGQGEEAGGYVVEHNTGAGGEALELADWGRLEDVEETEEDEGERGVLPVGGDGDEGDELAGYLVDDDVARVFAAGLAGDDGCGGNADKRGHDCGYRCADGQGDGSWMKDVGGGVPEEHG